MKNNSKTTIFSFSRFLSFLFIQLILFSTDRLAGQCGAPDLAPTIECDSAPLICLQNWCYGGTLDANPGHNSFCGPNTSVHNPQSYKFIVTDEEVMFEIHVDDCDSGNGLQSAILGACPWETFDVYDCDPGTPPGGTMFLHSTGFEIGQMGWLLIDGSNGSTCSYTITSTFGISQPELVGEISLVTATPTSTIPGYYGITVEATPPVANAHGYYWVHGWSGDTITSTDNTTFILVPCDIDPGIYTICARAFSGCDTTENETCVEFELPAHDEIIKSPSTFCSETFPFMWFDLTIPGPGTYTQSFPQPSGCPIDSIWQVDVYPESETGIIDTSVCDYSFMYEGEVYDASGTYLLDYPGQGVNGCDSIAELHLTLDIIELFIEANCLDSQFTLLPHILEHYLSNDSIYFSWYDCDYDSLLSTAINFTPDTTGCFCLVLEHSFCSDTICSTFESDPCETSCSLVQHTGCSQDPVLFTYDGEIPEGSTLHWLIDFPGAPGTYFSGTDSLLLFYDQSGCYRASLTIVDSLNSQTCVDSFCIESPVSIASFCCSEFKCDTCTTLMIGLSGTAPWTIYISDGVTTDTVPGITDTPYHHEVCPPADSTITYSLIVTDTVNECPAIITTENPVTIHLSSSPIASILQETDTLCANEGMTSYNWTNCQTKETVSSSQCFTPGTSGCYCVEIVNVSGCVDTACIDFLISAVSDLNNDLIGILPVPSSGSWEVRMPDRVQTPVTWSLVDLSGRLLEQGILSESIGQIALDKIPNSGLYYLKFVGQNGRMITSKVVILTE